MKLGPIDVKVGDQVVVSDVNFGVTRKTVTKVGRTRIHLGDLQSFLKAERVPGDDYNHATVYTLSEWADKQRQGRASEWLSSVGIRLDYGRGLSDRVVEIANALAPLFPDHTLSLERGDG